MTLSKRIIIQGVSCLWVPFHDFVIVSGSDDAGVGSQGETPNFTVVVRFHDGAFVGSFFAHDADLTVFGTDEHLTVEAVDSTDSSTDVDASYLFHIGGGEYHNLAVGGPGVEAVVAP